MIQHDRKQQNSQIMFCDCLRRVLVLTEVQTETFDSDLMTSVG